MTGTADPGGHGRRRPGPLARIGHDPDALEAFYTEHVTAAFYTLTETELTPAQQAALFRTLAGLPHLHLVKGATDALGRTGIGIAYSAHGESWTTIFNPRTFRPMGAVYASRSQTQRWGVAVPATVVDRPGQRP